MYNLDIKWDTYDYWSREEERDIYIEKEMKNYRQRALAKFSSIVPHPDFTFDVAMSIIIGYRESIEDCEELILRLCLDDMEILALEGNFELFKELYLNQREESYISEAI